MKPGRKSDPERVARIRQQITARVGVTAIARAEGCSREAIYQFCRRHGIVLPPQTRQTRRRSQYRRTDISRRKYTPRRKAPPPEVLEAITAAKIRFWESERRSA